MNNIVSIIIPVYRENLSVFELISLRQCFSILGAYKIQIVCPKRMEFGVFHMSQKDRATFVFLDDINFEVIASYNHMLLSVWFYELFINYKYILIYQLDCFVFKDDLIFWVERGFSYIGAPWFKNSIACISNEFEFEGVGNGGFSLRNVKDCIKVLKSNKKIKSLKDCIFIGDSKFGIKTLVLGVNRYFKKYSFKYIKEDKTINEDKVFSHAGKRFKFFKIPCAQVASRFAFEEHPDFLYRKNDRELPFGCHAWFKYDLEFYKPFLKEYNYFIDN